MARPAKTTIPIPAQSSSDGGQIKFSNATYCLSTGTDASDAARPRLDNCASASDAKGKGQAWKLTRKGMANVRDGGMSAS